MKLKKQEYLIIVDKAGDVQAVVALKTADGIVEGEILDDACRKYSKKFPKGRIYYATMEAPLD